MDSQPRPSVAAPLGLPPGAASDVVEETVWLPGRMVRMLRPCDGDAILDELLAEDDPDEDRLPFWAQLWPAGVAWPELSPLDHSPANGSWSLAAAWAWSG